MRTLGVDLAAATRKTAAAVIEWGNGTARLAHLARHEAVRVDAAEAGQHALAVLADRRRAALRRRADP